MQLIAMVFFISLGIYIIGIFTYENFLVKALEDPARGLAPYGIEILHLR